MMTDDPHPGDQDERIKVDTLFEFYLRHRDDALQVPLTFNFNRELLDEGAELADFQSVCVNTVLSILDAKAGTRMVFSDRKFNKFVIMTDDVQAVSILAPEEATIMRAIETGDSNGG
jgi:hypothetical protein